MNSILSDSNSRLALFLIILHANLMNVYAQSDTSTYTQFGIPVTNHYLWLEDINSDRTQAWLEMQSEKTTDLLGKGAKRKIKKWLQPKALEDIQDVGNLQFSLETYDKKPPVLKYRKGKQGIFIPLLNCKDFRKSKYDFPSVEDYWVTPEGTYLVAALSHSGSDWKELVVVNIKEELIESRLNGILDEWLIFRDGGFLYQHYKEPENPLSMELIDHKIRFHKFNTSQSEDITVFRNADRSGARSFSVFQRKRAPSHIFVQYPFKVDGKWKYAISMLEVWKDLILPEPFLIYESDYDVDFQPIFEEEDYIYFRTNLNAGNYCIIKCKLSELNTFEIYHPEYKEVMTNAIYLGSGVIGMTYLKSGIYSGLIKNGDKLRRIPVPKGANIEFAYGDNERIAYFSFYTHYLPPQHYEIDLTSNEYKLISQQRYSRGKYHVEILHYKNANDENLPIQIIYYNSDVTPEIKGSRPTLMHVYGGYGRIEPPRLSLENDFFLLNGGILAYPSVRGGGALGTQGELDGKGINKQNAVSDVVDAAEFLIENGFTNEENLFIEGGSHGGFLVAAAAIQRPELFKGVFAYAGVFDLIRDEGFGIRTHQINLSEYGDPRDSLSFHKLHKLSPIHQLKKGINYPSFFLIVGTNDSRVPPSNSFRFKALLDGYSGNPYNILHVTNGGHEVINYPSQRLEILGMKFQFILELTGHKLWKYY